MKQPSFIVRVLIVFIPLLIFLFLMYLAGITKNLVMTLLLSLLFVWFIQAVYKRWLIKRQREEEQ